MRQFEFSAWIHPRTNNDDYQISGTVNALTLNGAKLVIKKYLTKISHVNDDFYIKTKYTEMKNNDEWIQTKIAENRKSILEKIAKNRGYKKQ